MTTKEQAVQIEAMRTIAAAPLLSTLAANLSANSRIEGLIAREWWAVGSIALTFNGANMPTLHLRLSRVPSGYRADISHPPGYERAIREKFLIFRDAIRGFWREIRTQLATVLSAQEMSDYSTMRETETAFYWTPRDKYWVGIIGYYTDNNGKEYIVNSK